MKKNILILNLCLCFTFNALAVHKTDFSEIDLSGDKKNIEMEVIGSDTAGVNTEVPTGGISSRSQILPEENDIIANNLALLAETLKTKKVARLASFDGGGIRGILFAVALVTLEQKTKLPIAALFHMFIGTSTGGFAAVGLNIPDPVDAKKPKYTAEKLMDLYMNGGPLIFTKLSMIQRMLVLFRDKYSVVQFDRLLTEYFGDTTMADLLNDVLISYCNVSRGGTTEFIKSSSAREDQYWAQWQQTRNGIPAVPGGSGCNTADSGSQDSSQNQASSSGSSLILASGSLSVPDVVSKIVSADAQVLSLGEAIQNLGQKIVETRQSILGPGSSGIPAMSRKSRDNFFARDVLRATSAAPTYFPPFRLQTFQQVVTKSRDYIADAMDGGLSANKPHVNGLIEMFQQYPEADSYMVVSFGTGSVVDVSVKVAPASLVGLALKLPEIFMGDEEKMNHHLLKIFGKIIPDKSIF
ncbi:MAG: patatin-like phospholipase family protein, partial [Holosporaceae bacterium]|nr:patatin-like phospholipase family protein [Holosporaceae bacterium]